jgi:hypothetical protein
MSEKMVNMFDSKAISSSKRSRGNTHEITAHILFSVHAFLGFLPGPSIPFMAIPDILKYLKAQTTGNSEPRAQQTVMYSQPKSLKCSKRLKQWKAV